MPQAPIAQGTSSQAGSKPLPLWAAALLIGSAWLPAVLFAASRLPRFVAIFDEMEATGLKMPGLTSALMPLGRLGTGPLALAGTGVVALLIVGYAGWVRAELPGRRIVVASLLAVLGLVAFFTCLVATILPATAIQSQF